MKNRIPASIFTRGAIAILPILLAACSSTKMVNTWKEPTYTGGPFRKLAVFALAKEPGIQRLAEDRFCRLLPAGTAGTPSYGLFQRKELEDLEKVKARLAELGFDGALAIRLVTVDRSLDIIPASPAPYPGSFHGYYGRYAPAYYQPGQVEVRTTIVIESLLYSLGKDKLVWIGTSKTVDPQSTPEAVEGVIDVVTAELTKDLMVGSPPAAK